MTKGLGIILAASVGMALVARAADEKPAAAFKDDKEKASYAIGMYFGNQVTNAVKRSNMDIDYDVVLGAIKDVLTGHETKLTEPQVRETIQNYQQESRKKVAEKNKKEGEAFLAANKSKPDVKTLDVKLPDGTSAEMQYKVITDGTGALPKSNDMVSVNYRGTLINGEEFDSSAKRGQPARFMVTGVIRGWTEALERMKVGSKWQLFIPSSLAYGDMGNRGIDAGATLIFEVELLSAEAPPPPVTPSANPQPLTSDIIKVPSAEELKKGAKIEVIKAEDAARIAAQATNAPSSEKK